MYKKPMKTGQLGFFGQWGLILTLACGHSLAADSDRSGGSTGGGNSVVQRILMARLHSLEILKRTSHPDVTPAKREIMIKVVERKPNFSAPGEKVTAQDEQGEELEVSARYDAATSQVTFNVDLCTRQHLDLVDATALYLHEAGHAVGLSKSMARTKEDFRSDIGYRLVAEELSRRDSTFRGTRRDPSEPTMLFEEAFQEGKQGVDFDVATELCRKLKSLYQEQFFLLYCVLHQKNWEELRTGVDYYADYRFLGYETIASRNEAYAGATVVAHGLYLGADLPPEN